MARIKNREESRIPGLRAWFVVERKLLDLLAPLRQVVIVPVCQLSMMAELRPF